MAVKKRKKITGWASAFKHEGRLCVLVVQASHRPHAVKAMEELLGCSMSAADKEKVLVCSTEVP